MLTALSKQKGLIFFGVVAFVILAMVILIACLNNGKPSTGEEILASVPTVVGKSGWSYVIRSDANVANNVSGQTGEPWDFAGLTTSSVRAQVYSVGAENCSAQYKDAIAQTLEQIDLMHRLFAKYNKYFVPASSTNDIHVAAGSNRIAGFLAVDGGYTLDSRMSVLRDYYRLGIRSVALGGHCSTPWLPSPVDDVDELTEGDLNSTTFGRVIISEMNRLGMLIDLTGTTYQTQMEAINNSKAPVIFSSSASSNIAPHPFNVEDDVLIELNAHGGIIMVPFNSEQLCVDTSNCTVDNIIEHIEHIWNVTQSKSLIGLGGNVGMINVGTHSLEYPEGFSDSFGYVTLFNKLLANGNWSVEDLQDLAGNNFIRVLRSVEKVARDSAQELPAEVAFDVADVPLNDRGCYTNDGPLKSNSSPLPKALDDFHSRLYSFVEEPPTDDNAAGAGLPTEKPSSPTGTNIPTDPNHSVPTTTDTSTITDVTVTENPSGGTTEPNNPGGSAALSAGYLVVVVQLLRSVF